MRYPSSPQTLQRILTQGKGAIYVPTLKKLSLFIPATCPARLNGVCVYQYLSKTRVLFSWLKGSMTDQSIGFSYFRVYALPRIYYHNKQMECRVILVHDAKPISSKSAPNTSKPHQVQQVPSESPVQATRITLEYSM